LSAAPRHRRAGACLLAPQPGSSRRWKWPRHPRTRQRRGRRGVGSEWRRCGLAGRPPQLAGVTAARTSGERGADGADGRAPWRALIVRVVLGTACAATSTGDHPGRRRARVLSASHAPRPHCHTSSPEVSCGLGEAPLGGLPSAPPAAVPAAAAASGSGSGSDSIMAGGASSRSSTTDSAICWICCSSCASSSSSSSSARSPMRLATVALAAW
jgi:hypothetical protein